MKLKLIIALIILNCSINYAICSEIINGVAETELNGVKGYFFTREKAIKLINLKTENEYLSNALIIRTKQIDLLNQKINIYAAIHADYEKQLQNYTKQFFFNRILIITTAIGISISLAELIGFGVFLMFYNLI